MEQDPRKEPHVLETDIKNRMSDAREAFLDTLSLLEEAGVEPNKAREQVLYHISKSAIHNNLKILIQELKDINEISASKFVSTIIKNADLGIGRFTDYFPSPAVLKDLRLFITSALSKMPQMANKGRQGEIKAAKYYLWQLMKQQAPLLNLKLQTKWQEASRTNDKKMMTEVNLWLKLLSAVLKLLIRMGKLINQYEKSPGYSSQPGYK